MTFTWRTSALLLGALATAAHAVSAQGSEALIRQVGIVGTTDAQTLSVLKGFGFDPTSTADIVSPLIGAALAGPIAGSRIAVDQRGTGNLASVLQQGTRHVAGVLQIGQANVVDVMQVGSGHMVGLWLQGTANRVQVSQLGQDNRYFLDFRGDALQHSVVQNGIGLRAIQLGIATQPFSIVQQGAGFEVRIDHGNQDRE